MHPLLFFTCHFQTYEETSLRLTEEQLGKEFYAKAKPELGETHLFLVKGMDDKRPITPISPGEITFAKWAPIAACIKGGRSNEQQALLFYIRGGHLRRPTEQPEDSPPLPDVFIHHSKENITLGTFFTGE